MAFPVNPLDRYVSYTYHFELHCAPSWDELEYLLYTDRNDVTEPARPNGTLLINTRKDAHQTIDDVRYEYSSPWVDPSGTSAALAGLTLKVTEPGGVAFAEKLQRAMSDSMVKNPAYSMIYVLKIFFVGRKEDNSVDSRIPECPFGNVIPLVLNQIVGDYSYTGGTYSMSFTHITTAAVPLYHTKNNNLAKGVGYSHKNVSITASTVREAIERLEDRLNANYEATYVDDGSTKPIVYKITLDPRIEGKLYTINSDTFVPDDEVKLSWRPEIPIIDMIKTILGSSKEVNDMINESIDGIRKPHHPNVSIPTFSCRYHLTETEAIVYYDIMLYTGGGSSSGNDFIFDCYFAEPGKNVDVLDFEIKFINMLAWLQATVREGVDYYTNMSSQPNADSIRQESFVKNTLVPNKTLPRNEGNVPDKYEVAGSDINDVRLAGSNPRQQDTGYVPLKQDAVPGAKMAFNTIASMHGAALPQCTFDIRGHLNLLFNCLPNASNMDSEPGFGLREGIWLKVNIKDAEGRPFYYTGWYRLLFVDNIFSGGKFTQKLTCVMVEDEVQKGIQ